MKEIDPMTLVIFGATGDLAQRKILPALLDLFSKNLLPDYFNIIGFSRKDLTDADYREFVINALTKKGHNHNDEKIHEFLGKIFYKQGDIGNLETYEGLADYLNEMDSQNKICSNKLFYLAVPPDLYETIFNNLAESGLATPCREHSEKNWTRILVEKPFGSDAENARKLDKILGQLFEENQIFRIDHYLAKEALQNILTFRFANAIFEPLWNKNFIEKIEIKMYENGDVSDRGSFYDKIGALRDVGQNHLMQMLAAISMEDPGGMTAEKIRDARKKVLGYAIPFSKKSEDFIFRAQYDGYKNTDGIDPKSDTETYFELKLGIKNDRWQGVPFYLRSGKALSDDLAEIEIVFKDKESSVCHLDGICHYNNTLRINIQPNQEISICFWSKKSGLDFELEEKRLSFKYGQDNEKLIDAYEKVLYDAIKGDQTLFNSTAEIATEWGIIQKIKENWKNVPLKIYKKGINPAELKTIN